MEFGIRIFRIYDFDRFKYHFWDDGTTITVQLFRAKRVDAHSDFETILLIGICELEWAFIWDIPELSIRYIGEIIAKKVILTPLLPLLKKTVRNLNLSLLIETKKGGQNHFFCYNFANLLNLKLKNVSYECYNYPTF